MIHAQEVSGDAAPAAPRRRSLAANEQGFSLLLVLMLLVVVGLIAAGSAMITGTTATLSGYEQRQAQLESAADAGLEMARARLNGDTTIYPDSGFKTIENAVAVTDAAGKVVPGITRTTYVGPTGVATGQYGMFGSIVVVAQDQAGHKVIRRGDITQESFAKFAYFTNDEGSVVFGGGDQISGPVHSNDAITINSTGATFRGPGTVETAQTISGKSYGTFLEGYTEHAPVIPLPGTADLNRLKTYATQGGTAFTEPTGSGSGETNLRIEFVAIDLDGDGRVTGQDEGFFKVYQSTDSKWLMAEQPGVSALPASDFCGYMTPTGLRTSNEMKNTPRTGAQIADSLASSARRCLLGGDSLLNNPAGFVANDGKGSWVQRPFSWSNMPAVISARADKDYLFPLSHTFNPNFKGVIHVTGKVGISGRLRGRLTLAATGDIYILDDVTYANAPGVGNCSEIDMLGLFSGGNVQIADNALNSPMQVSAVGRRGFLGYSPGTNNNFVSFDDGQVTLHGIVLTLNSFSAQNYSQGGTGDLDCEGTAWGRGCLYLAGGIIQANRGPVGQADGHGFLKRYSYDACARVSAPPYFPTTGRFTRGRYYEVNPVGFDVAQYLNKLTAGK